MSRPRRRPPVRKLAMSGSLPPAAQAVLGAVLGCSQAGLSGKALQAAVAAAARSAVQGAVAGGQVPQDAGEGGAPPPAASPVETALVSMEVLLREVQACAGLAAKPSVSEAKALLRGRGAAALASRLGKVSKLRNTAGHPDVLLCQDIHEAFVGSVKVDANSSWSHGVVSYDISSNMESGEEEL
ncbi:unnamed protein product [Prorocentrum cordatum]|uniref:Uncharacterized protein n=1 Tax=Prorocentrum cordatum TaxID=2364126 RepID=A0ABN9UPH8_9DINO|nr:unnamed protein product [Polarella glacialis]